MLRERTLGTYAFFSGTTLCCSALFKADRRDQILELLAMDRYPIWPYRVWGANVLAVRGQIDQAIAYLRERANSTTSEVSIACFAEEELLKAGRRADAFNQHALLANQANTHLATLRALAKKYPELAKDKLLAQLVASTPGEPGKWFATAKTLKLFEQATCLAWASPCDPKTRCVAGTTECRRPSRSFGCCQPLRGRERVSPAPRFGPSGCGQANTARWCTDDAACAQAVKRAFCGNMTARASSSISALKACLALSASAR